MDLIFIIYILVAFFVFISLIRPLVSLFRLWNQARAAQAGVSTLDIIGMKLRKTDARLIVMSRIEAIKAGLDIETAALECHYLAGGRPLKVVRSLIAADHANIELSWKEASTIDLAAGGDIHDAVIPDSPKEIDGSTVTSDKATIDGPRDIRNSSC